MNSFSKRFVKAVLPLAGTYSIVRGVNEVNSDADSSSSNSVISYGNSILQHAASVMNSFSSGNIAMCDATFDSEVDEEVAPLVLSSGGRQPGSYSDFEYDRGFSVNVTDGLNIILQTSVGDQRNPAAVGAQIMINNQGLTPVYILSDQSKPGMQAVIQPGPQGKIIKLVSTLKPARGLEYNNEVLLSAAGIMSGKVTQKYTGDDFYSELAVQPIPGADGSPPNFEFQYNQAITPKVTLGGQLMGGFTGNLSFPSIAQAMWEVNGSWANNDSDKVVFGKLGVVPSQGGESAMSLNANYWQKIDSKLSLGASATFTGSSIKNISNSASSFGIKYAFPGVHVPTILTASVTNDFVTQFSLQKPYVSPVSASFLRTTLTGSVDHKTKDYKFGASVELYQ